MHGELRPGGDRPEWCDPDCLRRIRRRTLAKLRAQVAPVDAEVLGRFLVAWHGLHHPRPGGARLEEVIDQLEGVPLPWSALTQDILPARVRGFHPRMLDEMGAMGLLVWLGRGALGKKDGRVALYRRERVPLLVEPPPPYEGPTALHDRVLSYLREKGASFTATLQGACGRPSLDELTDVLWDLVWEGLITNDTFQPLGGLGRRKASAPSSRRTRPGWRRRSPGGSRPIGGRWSPLEELLLDPPSPTERRTARAWMLLERYGVLSREAAVSEGWEGGFAGIYPILKEMEAAGRVRRGWFVDGLGGAQFALPGAVDRLRACRDEQPDEGDAIKLAAVDPASPYGALLPWPDLKVEATLRRVAGASVVLVGGAPALYVEKGGAHVRFFDRPAAALRAGVEALKGNTTGRRSVLIRKVDGEAAREAERGALLREAGFVDVYKGLEFERL